VLPRHRRTPIRDIFRVLKRYRRAHGRYPSLFRPRRFSEKIQWRKLFDPSPLYSVFCDKLACRDFIEARLGPGHLPPLLWSGDDPAALPLERLPVPFVVKCAHGSGMNVFVDDPTRADFADIRGRVRAWQAHNYGRAAQEPGYAPVRPRLLIEPWLTEDDGSLPVEYKFFLFDGRVALIMVRLNADPETHSNWFMRADGEPVDVRFDAPRHPGRFKPPRNLDAMLAIAERLGAGFDHIRVDLLVARDRIYVGELTVYSFGGMSPSEPASFDLELGRAWRIEAPLRRALLAVLGMARPWRGGRKGACRRDQAA
jgi:hypothetical protein